MRPVGAQGPIKIGCSRWPENRLNDLAQWSPVPLEIIASAPGNFKLERHLHERFSDSRTHKEWFGASPELVAGIAKVAAGLSVEEAFGVACRYRTSRFITRPERLAIYSRAAA